MAVTPLAQSPFDGLSSVQNKFFLVSSSANVSLGVVTPRCLLQRSISCLTINRHAAAGVVKMHAWRRVNGRPLEGHVVAKSAMTSQWSVCLSANSIHLQSATATPGEWLVTPHDRHTIPKMDVTLSLRSS